MTSKNRCLNNIVWSFVLNCPATPSNRNKFWSTVWICSISISLNLSCSIVLLSLYTACTFFTLRPLPLSVHCSTFRCSASWLMVNFGLGPGGERGEEAAAMKKWWHFTAIIHLCFVPAALRSVCTGMECRAEGCWDGGMNGVGCEGRRWGRGWLGVWEVKKSWG